MTEARRTELEALVEQQVATIKRLEARVAELERQLGQRSSNSGKPPSSDRPAQRANRQRQGKRSHCKRGGQPGGKGKMRALVPRSTGCTGSVVIAASRDCGFTTCETLPSGASRNLLGPPFTAVLTGAYHLSRRRAVALVHDLTGVQLSLGAASHSERRVSDALATPVAGAHEQAREAPVKHIDETGWVQTAARRSLWTIATTFLTVLVIATEATRATVQQLLGAARGILVSDRATTFQFWSVVNRQVCWAHLIRKFVSFTENDEARVRHLGEQLLLLSHSLLHYWHQVREGTMTRAELRNITDRLRRAFVARLERGAGLEVRGVSGACTKLLEHEPAQWTFVYELGVDPRHNHAERGLRGFVRRRKKSLGTPSDRGSRFVERTMTVVHSLRKQHRDVLAFVTDACQAALDPGTAPSLLSEHE